MRGVRRSMMLNRAWRGRPARCRALLVAARQEARGVLDEDHRDVVDVAEADEARDFQRRIDVDLPGLLTALLLATKPTT
jgi:hypothetical protein